MILPMECVCGRQFIPPAYVGQTTCPCGLVWEYEEGVRPTLDSLRSAMASLVAAERRACMAAQCAGCRDGLPFHEAGDCHLVLDVATPCDALGIRMMERGGDPR